VIDTHAHLDVEAFDADRDAVIARARAAGVEGILVPAIRPATWSALARKRSDLVDIAIGIHPQVVPDLEPGELGETSLADVDVLAAALAAAARRYGAVAIGECGLDRATAQHDVQELVLRAHVRAARALRLPLIIHVLGMHDDAPRVLREERAVEVGGVLHSYSGGVERIPAYRDLDMAFSFAGPVSYANARKPVLAARAVPDELLLVETDAPDQAPEGHRGGRNEPAFLPAVIAGLAAARGSTPSEIAALTARNARTRFRAW